jgi:hypothetical protein
MTCDHAHEREVGPFMWEDEDGHRAYGVAFPDGSIAMLWDRSTWPQEERLLGEHISLYSCVGDVLQANGGRLSWGTWDLEDGDAT